MNEYEEIISDKIYLKKGDIFSSKLQTITIPVNIAGVMGKGLALKFKKEFPDIYKSYRSLCRQKKFKMGIPYLVNNQRNNLQTDFFKDTYSMNTKNDIFWVLLFPTKNHWKSKSYLDDIEKGLEYLSNNYKSWGIKSIAFPALGCGLGGLSWKDVGPLMCQYLEKMNIKSVIYLPIEKKIPKEQLRSEFLLSRK